MSYNCKIISHISGEKNYPALWDMPPDFSSTQYGPLAFHLPGDGSDEYAEKLDKAFGADCK